MSANNDREPGIPAPSDASIFAARDSAAFRSFRRAHAVVHLLDVAEAHPQQQNDLMRLSDAFALALSLETQLAREKRAATAYEGAVLRESDRLLTVLCETKPTSSMNKYIAAHINEFIAEDPARWTRFAQANPEIANRYHPEQPAEKRIPAKMSRRQKKLMRKHGLQTT